MTQAYPKLITASMPQAARFFITWVLISVHSEQPVDKRSSFMGRDCASRHLRHCCGLPFGHGMPHALSEQSHFPKLVWTAARQIPSLIRWYASSVRKATGKA